MKRFLKILFPLVAIPTAIVTLLAIAFFTFFPQEDIRAMVAKKIEKSIHRQVVIGPIHPRLTGIAIDSLKVSEVPSFDAAGPFVDAKGIRLGWNLRSLLEGFDVRQQTFTKSKGTLRIKEFKNPHYIANDIELEWSLRDMDPTGAKMNGMATLRQGPGMLKDVDKLVNKSAAAKVALAPVLTILNLKKLGVLTLGLPDLRQWPIDGIRGDYRFTDGLLTIRQFEMKSSQLGMDTTGTIHLGTGKLGLHATLNAPKTSALGLMKADMRIEGTTAKPKVNLDSLHKKAFKATVTNVINTPGKHIKQ